MPDLQTRIPHELPPSSARHRHRMPVLREACNLSSPILLRYIEPPAEMKALRWRCSWCRTPAENARYLIIEKMGERDLTHWKAPSWMRRLERLGRHFLRNRWPTAPAGERFTEPDRRFFQIREADQRPYGHAGRYEG